jgi:hypothetical protein
VVAIVEGDGDLEPLKLLKGGGSNHHDLPGYEFLLPPCLIGARTSVDVVDFLMSLGEVTLWFFGLFLLIDLFAVLSTSNVKPWSRSQS